MDALVEADPVFKLADATLDVEAFAKLDDSILKVGCTQCAVRQQAASFVQEQRAEAWKMLGLHEIQVM